MRLLSIIVAITAKCAIVARAKLFDVHRNPDYTSGCNVRFEEPLKSDTAFFNQFIDGASCLTDNFLQKGEEANPYDLQLPYIPVTGNVDDQLTAYFPEIVGPESIAVVEEKDLAYTGADDGWIYKIDLLTMKAIKLATACNATGVTECRPQGIRATSDNKLYFADSAGLCLYDIATDNVTVLVPRLSKVNGKAIMLPNDLDVNEDTKMIYMSDSSTKYSNTNILRGTLLHDNHGRVLAYSIETNRVSVLVDGLSFPNGIQLSHDKKTLLVNEMNRRRILQVTLDGASKGNYTVFTPSMPGEPDNIRAASNNSYWVAINLARNGSEKVLFDYLSNKACATENFVKMNNLVAEYLRLVAQTTHRVDYIDVADRLSSYEFVSEMASHQGSFLLIDADGKITKRYASNRFDFFSNPVEYKKQLLIGNDRNPYIVVVEGDRKSVV